VNLGSLLSPLAEAVTIGGISWVPRGGPVKEGVVRVGIAISVLAPCRLRMTVNDLRPSEAFTQECFVEIGSDFVWVEP
jgi:hypothetical protein